MSRRVRRQVHRMTAAEIEKEMAILRRDMQKEDQPKAGSGPGPGTVPQNQPTVPQNQARPRPAIRRTTSDHGMIVVTRADGMYVNQAKTELVGDLTKGTHLPY